MAIWIVETPKPNVDGAALEQWINESGSFSYQYHEALNACALATFNPGWKLPEAPMSGRVFGEKAEIRWRSTSAGRFDAWRVEECTEQTPNAVSVNVEDRSYFLIGRGTVAAGVFKEARYHRDFSYPVFEQLSEGAAANARAFVWVRHYRAPLPKAWGATAREIAAKLNQPRLVGHRFIKVDVDRGEQ